MSDTGSQGQVADTGTTQTTQQTTQQAGQQDQGTASSDWGQNDFLKDVPELDRPVVERYLKQIDGGITKRFQDLHAQYEPYQQLGDVETLQQALYLQQLIDNDPKQVYQALQEALADELQGQGTGQQGAQGLGQSEVEVPEEFQGLPPAFVKQFQEQQQALQAVAEFILNQNQQTQAAQQDQQLDAYLEQLKQAHGDFDMEFVLSKMNAGMDGEQAVKAWNTVLQNAINSKGGGQQQTVPPILGGGGVTPGGTAKKVTDLDRNETKNLVAQYLAAAQAQAQ